MPETPVPKLKLPSGKSSESEPSTSARSDSGSMSSTSSGFKCYSNNSSGTQKKFRKPAITHRIPKKAPLKTSAQLKTNIKSQVPRAVLLTPSSSSNSIIANVSAGLPSYTILPKTSDPELKAEVQPEAIKPKAGVQQQKERNTLTPYLALQRQHTATILRFHSRKSISQMDFKQARRTGNYQVLSKPTNTKGLKMGDKAEHSKALVPVEGAHAIESVSSATTSIMEQLLNTNTGYYNAKDQEAHLAGMRIFATIMLNAWRNRRNEVRRLIEQVNDLKRGSIKTKNQLHVFNSLFRVEQRRNEQLNLQLKQSYQDINNSKAACEGLTTSLISLKADKELVEQQLIVKDQEFENLNAMLTRTKSELFKALTKQRELQAYLSVEQHKIQSLENQKNDFINEICELNSKAVLGEEKYRDAMQVKDNEIEALQEKLEECEDEILKLKCKDLQLLEYEMSDRKLKHELVTLQSEVYTLQKCLAATLGNRLKNCLSHTIGSQRTTYDMLHWFAFYMLPATPAPRIPGIPFGLAFKKAKAFFSARSITEN